MDRIGISNAFLPNRHCSNIGSTDVRPIMPAIIMRDGTVLRILDVISRGSAYKSGTP